MAASASASSASSPSTYRRRRRSSSSRSSAAEAPESSSTSTASDDSSPRSARNRCSGRVSPADESCAMVVAVATTRRASLVNLSNMVSPFLASQ